MGYLSRASGLIINHKHNVFLLLCLSFVFCPKLIFGKSIFFTPVGVLISVNGKTFSNGFFKRSKDREYREVPSLGRVVDVDFNNVCGVFLNGKGEVFILNNSKSAKLASLDIKELINEGKEIDKAKAVSIGGDGFGCTYILLESGNVAVYENSGSSSPEFVGMLYANVCKMKSIVAGEKYVFLLNESGEVFYRNAVPCNGETKKIASKISKIIVSKGSKISNEKYFLINRKGEVFLFVGEDSPLIELKFRIKVNSKLEEVKIKAKSMVAGSKLGVIQSLDWDVYIFNLREEAPVLNKLRSNIHSIDAMDERYFLVSSDGDVHAGGSYPYSGGRKKKIKFNININIKFLEKSIGFSRYELEPNLSFDDTYVGNRPNVAQVVELAERERFRRIVERDIGTVNNDLMRKLTEAKASCLAEEERARRIEARSYNKIGRLNSELANERDRRVNLEIELERLREVNKENLQAEKERVRKVEEKGAVEIGRLNSELSSKKNKCKDLEEELERLRETNKKIEDLRRGDLAEIESLRKSLQKENDRKALVSKGWNFVDS